MADGPITEEQSKKILARWNKNASLVSFSLAPLSNQLDGLIGEQFFLSVKYQEGENESDIRFFVKILSKTNPVLFRLSTEMRAFERESFFYNTFIPALENCKLNCDYVAKSYLCESFAVVLEDLSQLSYKGSGKAGYLNFDHCYACLKALARFHANGMLFQLLKSKEYNLMDEFPDVLEPIFKKESKVLKYYFHSAEGIIDIAKLLSENVIKLDDFKKTFFAALDEFGDMANKIGDFKLTIIHNDLWTNNFLYKYDDNNKIMDLKIIDFQTLTLGPPAMDVITFLLLNTRKKFRDDHLNELLKYYYNCFSGFIVEKGFDSNEVLSEDEFYSSCDVMMVPAKIHSTVDRSITLLPAEGYLKAASSEEAFSDYIFEGRPKYMLEAFESDDNYRDIMTEDITELRSLLFR